MNRRCWDCGQYGHIRASCPTFAEYQGNRDTQMYDLSLSQPRNSYPHRATRTYSRWYTLDQCAGATGGTCFLPHRSSSTRKGGDRGPSHMISNRHWNGCVHHCFPSNRADSSLVLPTYTQLMMANGYQRPVLDTIELTVGIDNWQDISF